MGYSNFNMEEIIHNSKYIIESIAPHLTYKMLSLATRVPTIESIYRLGYFYIEDEKRFVISNGFINIFYWSIESINDEEIINLRDLEVPIIVIDPIGSVSKPLFTEFKDSIENIPLRELFKVFARDFSNEMLDQINKKESMIVMDEGVGTYNIYKTTII